MTANLTDALYTELYPTYGQQDKERTTALVDTVVSVIAEVAFDNRFASLDPKPLAEMTKDDIEAILSDANVDWDEDSVRTGYSGRGMNGRTCVGLVVSLPDLMQFFLVLGEVVGVKDALDLSVQVRSDGMGTSTIWYFPRWQLAD
jgi:hypothetical protein